MPANKPQRAGRSKGLESLKQVAQGRGESTPTATPKPTAGGKRRKMLPPSPSSSTQGGTGPSAHPQPKAASAPRAETYVGGPAAGSFTRRTAPPPTTDTTPIDPADAVLFRRAMTLVTPIKNTQRAYVPPPPKPPQHLVQARRERAAGLPTAEPAVVSDSFTPAQLEADDTRYVQNANHLDLVRQLERGRWVPSATLDLHGDTLEQARERLMRFLTSCLEHDIRCVRLIHGKGIGSRDGEPVLKTALRRWLMQLAMVQAFAQCREHHGGAGALDVLLKKPDT